MSTRIGACVDGSARLFVAKGTRTRLRSKRIRSSAVKRAPNNSQPKRWTRFVHSRAHPPRTLRGDWPTLSSARLDRVLTEEPPGFSGRPAGAPHLPGPLAEPSPIVPYTLLRPCANASSRSFYPECARWTSRPPEKNAGLHHYANGSALPNAPAFRAERDRLYEVCRTRGLARFPHYAAVDAVEPSRLRSLCAAKASGRPPRGG